MNMFTTSNYFYSILPFKVKISLKCMNGWLPNRSNMVINIDPQYAIPVNVARSVRQITIPQQDQEIPYITLDL